MTQQRSSRIIFRKITNRKPQVKFANGMFVRYTGHQHSLESRRFMATTGIVPGATYTVAHAAEDGAARWLFVQELPGTRLYADGFVPIPHQAEDHWQLAEMPVQGVAEA